MRLWGNLNHIPIHLLLRPNLYPNKPLVMLQVFLEPVYTPPERGWRGRDKPRGQPQPADRRCSQCGKMFGKRSDLTRHLRTHTGERPFACTLCHVQFALKGNLKGHMRRVHKDLTPV